jgi:hypothetical protein
LGTVGGMPRFTVQRRNGYLHINVGGRHNIEGMVAITSKQQKT